MSSAAGDSMSGYYTSCVPNVSILFDPFPYYLDALSSTSLRCFFLCALVYSVRQCSCLSVVGPSWRSAHTKEFLSAYIWHLGNCNSLVGICSPAVMELVTSGATIRNSLVPWTKLRCTLSHKLCQEENDQSSKNTASLRRVGT